MLVKKAVVKSFDSGTYTPPIQVSGSLATWLTGVPVARNIPTAEMVAGRSCALLLFDPANPNDGVVVAVYV